MLNGLSVVRIVILLFPVVSTIRPPDPIPLLQPHYRAFIALTDRSVPVLCIGTLASRFSPLALLPCHQRTGLLQFRVEACIRFTPPLRRSPSAQSSGTRQTYPSGASRLSRGLRASIRNGLTNGGDDLFHHLPVLHAQIA